MTTCGRKQTGIKATRDLRGHGAFLTRGHAYLQVCSDEGLASRVVKVAFHEEVEEMGGVAADGAQLGVAALEDFIAERGAHVGPAIEEGGCGRGPNAAASEDTAERVGPSQNPEHRGASRRFDTLKPMMKMLSVSSTVRQTSVDTLASSRHWLLTSASSAQLLKPGVQDPSPVTRHG
ncbi:hypothetical protein EYF80_047125 [Liparis tanakae]|uniref:Uncharacterized protein n=1 Tax=Liparis tanakae TaxID=230148 RepID=A0A4Z2FP66_9TELE|nr:hypothetical protein EYF80_047125 [Liparis tanakae]